MNFETRKNAVVTGGASGIGKAICKAFNEIGMGVVILDYEESKAISLAHEMNAGMPIQANVSDSTEATQAFQKILQEMGSIDVLVNCAGVARDNLVVRMTEKEWDEVINTNLKGTFNCTKAVYRPMMRQKSGRIINISSVIGLSGNIGQANYSASKAGVIALTKTTAKELSRYGITTNAIAPGFIRTQMTEEFPEEKKESILAATPLGRFGEPEEVAELVLFLASDKAGFINGEIIKIDGGLYM